MCARRIPPAYIHVNIVRTSNDIAVGPLWELAQQQVDSSLCPDGRLARRVYMAQENQLSITRTHNVMFVAFARTVQGSRGAPLAWTVSFGLVSRCLLGELQDPVLPDASGMQVYVDGPIIALRGTPEVITELLP